MQKKVGETSRPGVLIFNRTRTQEADFVVIIDQRNEADLRKLNCLCDKCGSQLFEV